MELTPVFAETPFQSHLLEPARPKANLVIVGTGAIFGMILVVAWVVYSPRIRVKRFSLLFWLGLAACSIVGPFFSGLFR
jgi:hypothetical protein